MDETFKDICVLKASNNAPPSFFVCGFNICPEILWCPSLQEMELNSLPPECGPGLVIGLLRIKYGKGNIVILQWRNLADTTSRLMSPVISHVDIMYPDKMWWEEHFTSVVVSPQSHKPSLTPRQTQDKYKLRDILHNPWLPSLTTVKVRGNRKV